MTTTAPDAIDTYAQQSAELVLKYGTLVTDAAGIIALLDLTRDAIATLLRRTSDTPHREKTLALVAHYFEAVLAIVDIKPADKLVKLKTFSTEIINIVIAERPFIAARAKAAEAASEQQTARRLADTNPELLAERQPERMTEIAKLVEGQNDAAIPAQAIALQADNLLRTKDQFAGANDPTRIQIVTPSPPYVCKNFSDLFPEAMCYRIERVTSFFQRHNPTVQRGLPRPFLLSPEFGIKLNHVIRTIVAPQMRQQSRNIGVIETSQNWENASVTDFWRIVEANERFKTPIKAGWDGFWQRCRQRPVTKPGINGKTVLQADPVLKEIRQALNPDGDEYTLPLLRNPEIDLLTALAFEFNPDEMEDLWNRLRQLYEQELDTRVYQEKARDGALRDSFLQAFNRMPDMVGDFMVILCYFCFPNVGLFFLDRFTHNKGKNAGERRAKLPYLMHFLDDPRLEQLKLVEAEQLRLSQSKAG